MGNKIVRVFIKNDIDPATGETKTLRIFDSAKLAADEAPITDAEKAAESLCADRPNLGYEIVKGKGASDENAGGNVDDGDDDVVYADLSPAELKAELTARKIAFTPAAKKAALIKLLETDDAAAK